MQLHVHYMYNKMLALIYKNLGCSCVQLPIIFTLRVIPSEFFLYK